MVALAAPPSPACHARSYRKQARSRYHLLIDADHYWLRAGEDELRDAATFLGRHRDLQLTLLTCRSDWDACLYLNALPVAPPCHLIAAHGETLLHLPEGAEWSPDEDFEAWKAMFNTPSSQLASPHWHPVAMAIQFLECAWGAPRPLFFCLGDRELAPTLALADFACYPAHWGHLPYLPADTEGLIAPTLPQLLARIETRISVPAHCQPSA